MHATASPRSALRQRERIGVLTGSISATYECAITFLGVLKSGVFPVGLSHTIRS